MVRLLSGEMQGDRDGAETGDVFSETANLLHVYIIEGEHQGG